MDLINIGKVVNAHGLKGEIKIISDFKYKKEVFKPNNILYINDVKYTISSYRVHKNYDMIILNGINDINDALNIKGNNVYINRDDYTFSGVLDEDLIDLSVYDNEIYRGKITEIYKLKNQDLLVVEGIKRHMIPNNPEFVKEIDLNNKKININYIKGLYDED